MHEWLLLSYKIPRQPTTPRVYVWRKLKKLAAILVFDAIWVLPYTSRSFEQFQWLAAEIIELGGKAHVWKSSAVLSGQEEALIQQFTQQTDSAYEEIWNAIQLKDADLNVLSRKYQQIMQHDHFQSIIGKKVREALLASRGGDDR
ncbi:Chromate resistance protein ChrB [Paenibacillus cremeus]|uniref:ChrB protein n=1 Tax=Paenibacillus cremeus TaxID=2163881 RepID=A0A559JVT4_9BACL|nr:Chromate resistance protein ChrB [Paenibacillus cremeus]TVY04012.1 ChrB protein [Paenibacillus cremeus]